MLEILFQDEQFVFVNKPSGILVHRTQEASRETDVLMQRLRDQLGCWVYPAHRLDRGVSGVIGFAKSEEGARLLQEALSAEITQKWYVALVRGCLDQPVTVDRPLTNDNGKAQSALTEIQPLASHLHCSLVRVRIKTGRRHQIRRHLSHLHHQVLGDRQYGKGGINNFYCEKYGLNRIFLHSWLLQWVHPVTGSEVDIKAPLPPDLHEVLVRLRDEGLLKSPVLGSFLET